MSSTFSYPIDLGPRRGRGLAETPEEIVRASPAPSAPLIVPHSHPSGTGNANLGSLSRSATPTDMNAKLANGASSKRSVTIESLYAGRRGSSPAVGAGALRSSNMYDGVTGPLPKTGSGTAATTSSNRSTSAEVDFGVVESTEEFRGGVNGNGVGAASQPTPIAIASPNAISHPKPVRVHPPQAADNATKDSRRVEDVSPSERMEYHQQAAPSTTTIRLSPEHQRSSPSNGSRQSPRRKSPARNSRAADPRDITSEDRLALEHIVVAVELSRSKLEQDLKAAEKKHAVAMEFQLSKYHKLEFQHDMLKQEHLTGCKKERLHAEAQIKKLKTALQEKEQKSAETDIELAKQKNAIEALSADVKLLERRNLELSQMLEGSTRIFAELKEQSAHVLEEVDDLKHQLETAAAEKDALLHDMARDQKELAWFKEYTHSQHLLQQNHWLETEKYRRLILLHEHEMNLMSVRSQFFSELQSRTQSTLRKVESELHTTNDLRAIELQRELNKKELTWQSETSHRQQRFEAELQKLQLELTSAKLEQESLKKENEGWRKSAHAWREACEDYLTESERRLMDELREAKRSIFEAGWNTFQRQLQEWHEQHAAAVENLEPHRKDRERAETDSGVVESPNNDGKRLAEVDQEVGAHSLSIRSETPAAPHPARSGSVGASGSTGQPPAAAAVNNAPSGVQPTATAVGTPRVVPLVRRADVEAFDLELYGKAEVAKELLKIEQAKVEELERVIMALQEKYQSHQQETQVFGQTAKLELDNLRNRCASLERDRSAILRENTTLHIQLADEQKMRVHHLESITSLNTQLVEALDQVENLKSSQSKRESETISAALQASSARIAELESHVKHMQSESASTQKLQSQVQEFRKELEESDERVESLLEQLEGVQALLQEEEIHSLSLREVLGRQTILHEADLYFMKRQLQKAL